METTVYDLQITNYRTKSNAERITSAVIDGEDVIVHVACADANPSTVDANGINYEFEDGECCAVCGNDLHAFPDLRWSECAERIMSELEHSAPGGQWEEKYIYLNKDGTGCHAANVYYPPQGDAIAVLYPAAQTTKEWEA